MKPSATTMQARVSREPNHMLLISQVCLWRIGFWLEVNHSRLLGILGLNE